MANFPEQPWYPDFTKEKVSIKAVLKSNPSMYKEFTMYIKKKPNDEKLKTLDEMMNENNSIQNRHERKETLITSTVCNSVATSVPYNKLVIYLFIQISSHLP